MTVTLEKPPTTLRFAREDYSDSLLDEMRPLWDAHNDEIPLLNLPLEIDYAAYENMHRRKMLRIYTARLGGDPGSEDTLLVGYQVFMLARHPHRKYSLEAAMQLLYLDPEVRKGFVGIKFMKFCWAQLEAEGVNVIHQQISAQKDFGVILERYGFDLMDITYSKVLRRNS